MFTKCKNPKGQGVVIQYAMTFTVVLGIVIAMGTYFKRVVQGRIAGARDYAKDLIVDTVYKNQNYNIAGRFKSQYEPYYTQTRVEKELGGSIVDGTAGGVGRAAIQTRQYNGYSTRMTTKSNQLPPRDNDI